MNIWMPQINVGSGSDMYVSRLLSGLRRHDCKLSHRLLPHAYEMFPWGLSWLRMPAAAQLVFASSSWSAFALRRGGVPLVVAELHCVLDPAFERLLTRSQRLYYRSLIYPQLRRSLREADAVVCISHHTAKVMEAQTGRRADAVIHCWLDPAIYKPREEPAAPQSDTFRLLFVGNPSLRKGVDLLDPLMERLGPGFSLSMTSGLRGRESGSAGRIVSLGKLSQAGLIEAYRDADAVLVPSRYEGFSYVALEAMACGKPVIAFSATALPEVVADGETGLLVPQDDLDGLVEACRRLANDRDAAVGMGRRGRQRVLSTFDENRLVGAYVDLFSSLL